MRRATLLTMVAALMLALTAGVAVAKVIDGTKGNDKLVGTSRADTLNGFAGNDKLYGKGGNDTLKGYIGDDPVLRGAAGDDTILGGIGSDRSFGDAGDDTIRTVGDTQVDFVNCGADVDFAEVSGNDVVDGTAASALTTTTLTSCEQITVDGIPVPNL